MLISTGFPILVRLGEPNQLTLSQFIGVKGVRSYHVSDCNQVSANVVRELPSHSVSIP
jgi:hypothetical protein